MNFLAAFGLAIIIGALDLLFCGFVIFMNDENYDDAPLIVAIFNTVFFVLTLTLTICKLKLGIL